MKKAGILVAIIVVLAVVGWYSYYRNTNLPDIDPAKIEIQDLSGIPIKLADQHQRPAVIFFSRTSSSKELYAFKIAYSKYAAKINFVVISDEETEKITIFKTTSMSPFFFAHSVKPFGDYEMYKLPAIYFFNSSGTLVSKKSGSLTETEIETEISKIVL